MTGTDLDDSYANKTDFSHIYDQPDPRAYYTTLVGDLAYAIPVHGAEVFRRLLGTVGAEPTMLDLCCSYGVNAAVLNHDLTMGDLFDHYRSADAANATPDQMLAIDQRWYGDQRRPDAVDVIGLDVAPQALRYAVEAGIITASIQADLEADAPDADVVAQLAQADLVTVTGGIGYIGETTFEHILNAAGDEPPLFAALSLRWVDFEPVGTKLASHGLVVETVDHYCAPQRAFTGAGERDAVFTALDRMGIDPTAGERQGFHCAELYVARTPEHVRDHPLDSIFAGLSSPVAV